MLALQVLKTDTAFTIADRCAKTSQILLLMQIIAVVIVSLFQQSGRQGIEKKYIIIFC